MSIIYPRNARLVYLLKANHGNPVYQKKIDIYIPIYIHIYIHIIISIDAEEKFGKI